MATMMLIENDEEVLGDCLVDLPPFGSFPVKSFSKSDTYICSDREMDELYPCATVVFEF